MEQITFENLPAAVSKLLEKVSNMERQLLITSENAEQTKASDKLLTVHQAATFLSLAVPTIYTMVSKGELPFMKRSKRIYFSSLELMNYLKEGRQKPLSEIAAQADQYLAKKKGGSHA